MSKPVNPLDDLSMTERLRIAALDEAARLSSLSVDSLIRHHSDKIIDLAPRRKGMRVQDALMIRAKETTT